jgi:hypothetical protein
MFYRILTNHNCLCVYSESVPRSRATCMNNNNNLMHMWLHVTNHLIISNDKDSNSENRIKLHVCNRGVIYPCDFARCLYELGHEARVTITDDLGW